MKNSGTSTGKWILPQRPVPGQQSESHRPVQVDVRLRCGLEKSPQEASSVREEAGKELQVINDKKASYHVEAPAFLRIVPILSQTR